MSIQQHITGHQHLGIPTADIDKTLAFFSSLGFETAYHTLNNGDRVYFIRLKDVTVETYESKEPAGKPGAIDHIALDVDDIEESYREVTALGYSALEDGIQYLPFWENGVRYFTIMGPNGEKVEFSQML